MKSVTISEFLNHSSSFQLIDSRSPAEFLKGHIPGSRNICLLNDEHRQIIGTIYKQEGRGSAVLEGFRLVGPHFHEISKQLLNLSRDSEIGIYCWRGGMRSEIMGWIASLCGLEIMILKGGYKRYRKQVLQTLDSQPDKLIVLSGNTGSGKTEILKRLQENGWPVIDLERLAGHRGSSFGALGMPPQTQEMFENELAKEVNRLKNSNFLIVEDESRMIGTKCIPIKIHRAMKCSIVVELLVSKEERVKRLVREYAVFDKTLLAEATKRIEKRLGNERMKTALNYLEDGDFKNWVAVLLDYYDKAYLHGRSLKQQPITRVAFNWKKFDASLLSLERILKSTTESWKLKS
jgi:tRNA 2-selenouridine synthase